MKNKGKRRIMNDVTILNNTVPIRNQTESRDHTVKIKSTLTQAKRGDQHQSKQKTMARFVPDAAFDDVDEKTKQKENRVENGIQSTNSFSLVLFFPFFLAEFPATAPTMTPDVIAFSLVFFRSHPAGLSDGSFILF